jgi:hypothetical protein
LSADGRFFKRRCASLPRRVLCGKFVNADARLAEDQHLWPLLLATMMPIIVAAQMVLKTRLPSEDGRNSWLLWSTP